MRWEDRVEHALKWADEFTTGVVRQNLETLNVTVLARELRRLIGVVENERLRADEAETLAREPQECLTNVQEQHDAIVAEHEGAYKRACIRAEAAERKVANLTRGIEIHRAERNEARRRADALGREVDTLRNRVGRQWLEEAQRVRVAVANCGIAGIYDDFADPVDAIQQMARYIKDHDNGDGSGWTRHRKAPGHTDLMVSPESLDMWDRYREAMAHLDDVVSACLNDSAAEGWCAGCERYAAAGKREHDSMCPVLLARQFIDEETERPPPG